MLQASSAGCSYLPTAAAVLPATINTTVKRLLANMDEDTDGVCSAATAFMSVNGEWTVLAALNKFGNAVAFQAVAEASDTV